VIGTAEMVALAMAWKGQTGALGWGNAAESLKDRKEIRGPLAYVLGHRLIRLGRQEEAAELLRFALADAPPDSRLARLAQEDLDLLAAGQGRLLVTSEFPRAVRLAVKRGQDAVKTLEVAASETIELESGTYELALADSASDRYLSTDRVEVAPAGRYRVKIHWLWKPGSAEHRLPGLVPRPADLPGVGRWQLETQNPREEIESVAWQPNGDLLACGSGTGDLRVYDTREARLAHFAFAHPERLWALAWNPDGKWLATVGLEDRGTIRLWRSDGTPGAVLEGQGWTVRELAWHPHSTRIASRSANQVCIRSVDGALIAVVSPHPGGANGIAWSRDGKWLATAFEDGIIRLCGADGNAGPELKGHTGAVNRVAYSPDGRWLASTGDDGTVRLWQPDGAPGPVMKGEADAVLQLAWSPDSHLVAAVGSDTNVQLWGVDGKPVAVLRGHETSPVRITWSPDGQRLATASYDTLRFWTPDGTAVGERTAGSRIWCLSWSHDGTRIAMSCADSSVQIWGVDGVVHKKWGSIG